MFGQDWNSELVMAFAILIQILLVVIPVCVTLHILLHKSDPKSSLLWIALVWFAPLLGAAFYFLFGINRIDRRARKLIVPIENEDALLDGEQVAVLGGQEAIGGLTYLGDRVVGLSRTFGNTVDLIQGVDAGHVAMIEAVSQAKDSVLLSTYIFRYDDLGIALADALVAADQRGVDVTVLLDGFGNGLFRSRIYKKLNAGGVEVHRFLHSVWPWRMPHLNLRNHRKILVVDGKVGFTGSLNIGRVKNLETHFRVQGPVVNHLVLAFNLDWKIAGGKALLPIAYPSESVSPGRVSARGILSGPIYQKERLRWMLLGAMGSAKSHIRILTPYFIPDQGLLSGLVVAALRGVRVDIVLPKHSNYPLADWAGRRQLRELIRAGCRIYLREGLFDHSKLMTVDGRWALVGSSNWDARSLRLNFEFDVEFEDSDVATRLEDLIDQRIIHCLALDPKGFETRPIWLKLRDATARLFLPYL